MRGEDQIDQAERRETLDNDLKVLQQQGSTFHQHGFAQADETNQGRFRATGTPRVIGSTPTPSSQYPAASAHQFDPCGPEPSLGYAIDAMPGDEPSTASPLVEVTDGPAAHASSSGSSPAPPASGDLEFERAAGSSPSTEEQG